MQFLIPFTFLILAHFAVSAPTEKSPGRIRPIKTPRNLDNIQTDVGNKSGSDFFSRTSGFTCPNPEGCHLNTAESVENKALQRRAGPGDDPATQDIPRKHSWFRKGCAKTAKSIAEGFSACMGRGTSTVEGEAAEVDPYAAETNDKKKKKTRKQKSQPGTPTGAPEPYNEGFLNKAVEGLQRLALVSGVKVWGGYIKFEHWIKKNAKQRAERKQKTARMKSGREGSNGSLNQAPERDSNP
ncbi:hypothetical protein PspLS_09573 [Pyricularia sp. CBS 133598]|nr:hypothetical protein PspLS_09573 [Pyricularia sp. CBS 133598]